ncbi:hypothetical protein ISS05_03640 [Candidatus Woesearchaeota archaeon]|nr:hypothetical protein [Candidatus Woesearchaeota archaeon]
MKIKNKKGVSPLIATILLISFAVALGVVVMSWGRNIEISNPGDKCSEVDIKVREVNNYNICYSGSGSDAYINFVIDNIGNPDLHGISLWVVGEKETKLFEIDNILIKQGSLFDKKDKELAYDLDKYGKIKHAQFIPKIKIDETIDICPKNSIKADKAGIC